MSAINLKKIHKNSFGDEYFPEINNYAFDNVGSTATFSKVFDKELKSEKTLFIIVGSDSGLLIPYLQKHKADKGRKYIILEKPEIISYIEKNVDINDNLIEVLPLSVEFNDLSEKYADYIAHSRYKLLRSLAVIDSHSQSYRNFWEEALDKFNIFSSTESGYAINNIFIDSQLKNLSLNEIPVQRIEKSLQGLTAIIMGGGPSLDENINWIRENQTKLVIFAAARISDRLKKEKIEPDFFVTVDPHVVSYDNSKSMLMYGDSAILIHSNNANAKLVAEWTGLRAYLGLRFPWQDSQHKQPDNLNIVGPTVTNTMASVAGFLGAEQVIFSGVDFCYGKNGQSYESNSVESKLGKYLDTSTNRVTTYSGRIAETTPSFANARQGMEDLVAYAIKFFENKFFTLSKEAAKIEGVTYSSAKNIQLSEQDKYKAIELIQDKLAFNLNDYKVHLADAKSYCQKMQILCKEVAKLSRKGKKTAKQLFVDLDRTDRLTHEIISIQQETNLLMGEHAEFIFNYSIKSYKDFMDPSVDQENMTRDEIKKSFVYYFNGLIKSSIPLRKSIEEAITKLNHRINETKGVKPLTKLINNWQKYHEEGRPNVWLKINNLTLPALSTEDQEKVKALLKSYQTELNKTDTTLSKQLKLQGESMANTFVRIQRYFAESRIGDLEVLINYIAEKDEENAEDLCNIGSGYLYELKEMPDEALNRYLKLKDENLLMEGLKRIVNITLEQKNYDSALNALEVLTNYSDEYFISYADILGAMGDLQGASEIYLHYLKNHEKDTATWIKLAKILIHNGILDEAINAINKVQELEPENPVAIELMMLATQPRQQ